MERGIVTPAQEIITNGNSLTMNGGLPPEQIRFLALYWDKVVVTDSNIFGSSLSDESQVLVDAGILRKETARMSLNGTFDGSGLAKMHFHGLSQITTSLTEKNPGQWALHQSGNQLYIPKNMSKELVTADFELNKCLPVPLPNIPLEKLIEFKFKRNDELTALRKTLDDLYLEISNSQDIPRAKIAKISQLEKAIKDLDVVAIESWGSRLLASRKVSLDINLGSLSKGAIAGGVVGASFGSPIVGMFAAAGQAILSSMKFEVSSSNQLASSVGNQLDLSYLSALKQEHFAK
ncbi:DUF6236 family protein [Pseudoalteromonas sp. BZB3]|uniref:DUF6236 family protein n=1 Tax=Pseudoalteromonas sp. BZB3 TaxID=3136670 RepID=UPI0032C42EED